MLKEGIMNKKKLVEIYGAHNMEIWGIIIAAVAVLIALLLVLFSGV